MTIPETFFTVSEELKLFGLSCLFGAAIGIAYDVLRTLRLLLPHNTVLVAFEDIMFLVLYGAALVAFSEAVARSEMRLYFAVGNVLGFTIYFFTAGSVVIRTLRKLFSVLGAVLKFIFRPVKAVCVILRRKAAGKFVGIPKVSVKPLKKIKMVLLNPYYMLYNKMANKKGKT